jgi:hypothetical protein
MGRNTRLLLLTALLIIISAITLSLNTSDQLSGYVSVYTGYNHNLDYNYFHIEEFITDNPDYFSKVPAESITPCLEAFKESYYIDNTLIQDILHHENVVNVHPAFIFSVSGKDSINNSISFDVLAVEPTIIEVFKDDGVEGRFLREGDEGKIVVNQFMKDHYGVMVGDSIHFVHDFYWKQQSFEVVGVLDDQFNVLSGDSALVLMSSKELFNMLNVSRDEELYNLLYVCTRNPVQALNKDELVNYLNSVFPDALISARNIKTK